MAPTLAAGPLLGARCVNFGPNGGGPFRPGSGLGAWAPQPPKLTTRERTRAFGVVGAPPHFVRTPYARMLGPPHELQACLLSVRWSLSNRPYPCRRALSVCRDWVCLDLFVIPSWSQCLARFIQSLGRYMAAKLTPKGPLPPFGYKKIS